MITTPIHYIGKFIKTIGFKGELVLRLDVNLNEEIENSEILFITLEGLPVPFFPENEGIWIKDEKTLLVKLNDIENEIQAKKLINKEVGISNFIKEEKLEESTINALKNYKVIDINAGEIGYFEKIIQIPGNPLMQIFKENIEILLPFSDKFIKETNHQNKILKIETPDGLLEIYLNPE